MTERTAAPAVHGARVQRSTWLLWAVAAAVLAPAVVPFGALTARVFGAGRQTISILASGRTAVLALNTVLLVGAVTLSASAIGIAAAWVTERTDMPGRTWWRVLIALPLVVPSYVIALGLIAAWGPSGLLADITGVRFPVLSGFVGAWFALTISTYPFVYLAAAAALRQLDPAHEEAARGLGAGPGRVFRTVVLPQLRPAAGAGALLAALYTLSDFGAVSLMRFDAFTRLVYAQYAGRLDRTPAAVLALLLVVIALVILGIDQRSRGRAGYHGRSVAGRVRPLQLTRRNQRLALVALALLVLLAFIGPIATLVGWILRGGSGTAAATLDWGSAAGSVAGSALAAVIAMAAAVPVAILVTRHRTRATGWLERVAYVVFSLPHIAVALGAVLLASRYLGGLYQSLTLLVLVYAAVFFAQALGPARAAMLQIDPVIEDASRSLGKSRSATTLAITLPLIRNGVLAGGLLVFLTTMKELPATLLLRPTGFDTLAIDIWSSSNDLLYAPAAASALFLVAVSAIPMYLLATRDDR